MSVRNRIAMFEQTMKEGPTPEERGRSPGVSSIASGSDSPRPLSKVRTSFVAIEKDGRIGLQRNPSETSSISGRKLSEDTEAASTILQETTRINVASPESQRFDLNRTGPASSVIANSSLQDSGSTPAGQPTTTANPSSSGDPLSTLATKSLSGPNRPSVGEKGLAESPQIRQAPKHQGQGAGSGKPDQVGEKGESQASLDKDQGKARHGIKNPIDEGSDSSRPSGNANRPPINGTGSGPKALNKVEKTPKADKALNGVDKVPNGVDKAPNGVDKARTTKPATPNGRVFSSQSKAAGTATEAPSKPSMAQTAEKKTTAEKKPARPSISPSAIVKLRSKSPTRPVKLPASLTTHTAASGSKTKTGATPEQPIQKPRSVSTSSVSSSGKTLRRSSSVINRQRPSVGPPPKQVAKDHPVPKKESKVDEDFLARMMRPTQSSANKAAEKVTPTTPPRRSTSSAKKPGSAKSGPVRKPVSKTASAANSVSGSPVSNKKDSSFAADEAISVKPSEKKADVLETPKTPERELVIVEEEEETEETLAKAPAKKEDEASKDAEAEKAGVSLTNGHQEKEETSQGVSADESKAEINVEKPVNQSAPNGIGHGAPQVQQQQQQEDEEETW